MNAFDIYRYIEKRMKACSVPKDAISCDCDERILSMAKRALTTNISGKRTEELVFMKAGNRWFGSLEHI